MKFVERFSSAFRSSFSTKFWSILLVVLVVFLIAICVTKCTASNGDETTPVNAEGFEQSQEEEREPNKVNTMQLPDSSFIYDVSIEELASADSYLDGQTVQVIGEVVGDRIIAEGDPKYCWITLQSPGSSDSEILIYMPVSSSTKIDTYGAYGKHGTTLQVRGTFNLTCTDHQGASEVHSENVMLVSRGAVEKSEFSLRQLFPGIMLLIAGCVIMLTFNYLRERER